MKKAFVFIIIMLFFSFTLSGCSFSGLGDSSGGGEGSSRGTGKPAKTGEKCASDTDCGVGACSEERDKSIQARCVDNKCAVAEEKECEEGEICLVDSRGADCRDKVALTTPRPTIGCAANTNSSRVGFNPFSIFSARCQDDCAPPKVCDGNSCTCEDPPANPPAPCPEPEFFYEHEIMGSGLGGERYTFLKTSDIFFGGLTQPEDPTDMVLVPAFRDISVKRNQIFPFPDEQFDVMPPPLPEIIHGTYCANNHYDAVRALDVDLQWIPRPTGENEVCNYGNSEVFNGVLRICVADLIKWFEEYSYGAPDFWGFMGI